MKFASAKKIKQQLLKTTFNISSYSNVKISHFLSVKNSSKKFITTKNWNVLNR